MNAAPHRDIVCIGVTDGLVLPLAELVAQLPADFPAAVFILSMRCSAGSLLPTLLGRCAALPVAEATDGEPIAYHRIRVSPCDRQLRLTKDSTELGARDDDRRVQPTVDELFASAASLGRRVIGIILGAGEHEPRAGADAIHRSGGLIVEATADALPSPSSSGVHADFVVPVEHIAALLMRLTVAAPTASGSFPSLDHEGMQRANLVVTADRVPVIELLVEAVAAADATARTRAVELRCVWERDVSVVLADRRRLRRTLAALLVHTIERTPRGGAVLLSAEVGTGEVRFCVADTGSPSTLEQREHMLDDDASCSYDAGSLERDPASAVREFVESHGGRIWIDSDPSTGSAFFFTLPSLPCVSARNEGLRA